MCARNAVGMQRRTELHRPQMQPFPPLTAAQRLSVGLQEPWRGGCRCCVRAAPRPLYIHILAGSPLFMLKPSFEGDVHPRF